MWSATSASKGRRKGDGKNWHSVEANGVIQSVENSWNLLPNLPTSKFLLLPHSCGRSHANVMLLNMAPEAVRKVQKVGETFFPSRWPLKQRQFVVDITLLNSTDRYFIYFLCISIYCCRSIYTRVCVSMCLFIYFLYFTFCPSFTSFTLSTYFLYFLSFINLLYLLYFLLLLSLLYLLHLLSLLWWLYLSIVLFSLFIHID